MRKLTLFAVIALALALPVAAQEILFDQMVEAAGLKCFPVQGDATTWYYLPDQPHLVTDADGNPEFSFLMYVTPTKQGESGINKAPGGGVVHFLVAYDVPPDQVRRAQAEVRRKKPDAQLVGPINYVDGTFALITAVTDPQAGLSRRVVGVGNAPVMAGHKAAVSMHLTPEGASLLWESFKQRTPDISVAFEMTVSGYRNPVEAAMSIDWQKVNQTMQIEAAGRLSFIAAEVDIMLQKMRNNGAIKVELKGAPPSQWNDIQSLGLELARQYLFESQGASGLAGLGAAGAQQSPLDRLWKAYGDEWKQQKKTSSLDPRVVAPHWLVASLPLDLLSPRVAWRTGATLLIAGGEAPRAGASPTPDPRAGSLTPEQEQGKNLFIRAMNLYNMQQYKEALELFEASAARFPLPETQWNIGQTHVWLGHTQEAVTAFGNFIAGKGGDAEHPKLRATVDALAGEPQPMPKERRSEWVQKLKEADKADTDAAPTNTQAAAPQPAGETAAKHAVSGPGSETLCEQASTLFAKGLEAWDSGRIQDAINYLEQADNLCHKADFTWNLGVSHMALGQRDLALAYLDRYLQEVAECRKKPLVAAARDLIAAAPAQIPDEMRGPLWRPLEDACGSIPVKSMKVGATGAAAAEQALAALPAVAAGGPTKTPTPTPKKGALPGATGAGAAAGATPTRTATRATPTATPKPSGSTPWGVIASFKLRRVESTGAFNLNLKQWLRTERPVRFAANIGDLSGLMGNPRYFRRVNLDDPVFKQREIPVSVDVRGEDAFADMLNAVTVTLKKRHESGKETLGEVTISRAEFAGGKLQTLVYGWDQDNNRTRWLDYEVRERWNYVGGPVVETPWTKTSAGALVLEPPLRPRALILEADPTFLQTQGVRDVVVEVRYRAADAERIATATVRAQAPSGETRLLLYQDPQQPGYSYSYTWRLRGGDRRAAGPFKETADIIYLDEVPPGS
jgi:tetratricopeptide (TPR) repeat protein